MRKLLSLIVLLSGMAAAAPAATRSCRIVFLEAPPGAPESLHLFDGSGSREVELPRMNFSQIYDLPAGALQLHLLPNPPADPPAIPPEAPSVKLAASVNDFFLLVTGDSNNKIVPVKMQIIDAGGERLRAGQTLWINLTPHAVGGTLGTRQLVVEPKTRVVTAAPAAGLEDYAVNLNYRVAGKDLLYPLCETKWRHNPRSRNVAFILVQNASRTPRIMVFPDYRDPDDKKATNR